MTADNGQTVFVEAPARLHFGLLDLRGALGRVFGGIGAAAPAPTLLVSARPAADARGRRRRRRSGSRLCLPVPDRSWPRDAAGVGGARLRVHRTLPPHVGLGSGTQLALAVGRALAEIYGIPTDAPATGAGSRTRPAIGDRHVDVCRRWSRARRRAEASGRLRRAAARAAALSTRVAVRRRRTGLRARHQRQRGRSGVRPSFRCLPKDDAEQIAHLVLMALLPALADADLATFGAALSAIQAINGRWFAPVQGGTFAPRPERGTGAPHGRVGRGGRRTELVGSDRLRHR